MPRLAGGDARNDRAAGARSAADRGSLLGLARLFPRQPSRFDRSAAGLIDGEDAIDDQRCQELYDRFIGPQRYEQRLHRAGGRMEQLAVQLVEAAAAFGRGVERYASNLDAASAGFGAATDQRQLAGLVGSILDEMATVRRDAAGLRTRLEQNTHQVQALRGELQQAWREARTDDVTGLANRRHFELAVRTAAAHAAQQCAALALMLIGVDDLEPLKQRHGRGIVDAVLRVVTTPLRTEGRPRDVAARVGCHEFAVIMPETTLQEAFNVANRLRSSVASRHLKLKHSGQALARVTISLGVAAYNAGESAPDWVDRAEDALDAAQRAGQNRVVALSVLPGGERTASAVRNVSVVASNGP